LSGGEGAIFEIWETARGVIDGTGPEIDWNPAVGRDTIMNELLGPDKMQGGGSRLVEYGTACFGEDAMSNGMFVFAVMLFSGVALSRAGVPVEAGRDEFVVVKKVPAVDCRVVRGFLGVPVDGSVYSRDYRGTVREYPRTASDGVVYSYNKNDGLHITLSDGDGFDVIVLRGGANARVYANTTSLTEPRGTKALHRFLARLLPFFRLLNDGERIHWGRK